MKKRHLSLLGLLAGLSLAVQLAFGQAPPPLPGGAQDQPAPTPPASGPSTPLSSTNANDLGNLLRAALTNQPARGAGGSGGVQLAPPAPAPLPGAPVAAQPQPGGATIPAAVDNNGSAPVLYDSALIQLGPGMPLEQFLDIYAGYSHKTVLRPSTLTAPGLTLSPPVGAQLTVDEVLYAMDRVLELNGISMVPDGDKFITAVPLTQASVQPTILNTNLTLPDSIPSDRFVNQIVEVKSMLPSELAPLLGTFTATPNAITPFDHNGTLLIRDHAGSVRRMLEVVSKIDVLKDPDYKLAVIPIKYGKVIDFYNTMSSLISSQGGASAGSRAGAPARGATAARGITPGNSVTSPTGARATPAIPAPTAGVSQAQQNAQLLQIARIAAGGATTSQLLEDARIVPDERSNTLLVFANSRDMDVITNIVSKLDVVLAQVLIEAVILEVQLGDSQTLGVSALQNQKSFGHSILGGGGFNNGQPLLSSITNLAGNLPSGFSYYGSFGSSLDLAVQAIASDQKATVLSRPRIQTSHAIPASFVVAQQVPYVTGTSYQGYNGSTPFGPSSTIQTVNIGITLNVTPFITPDGLVVMELHEEASQRGADVIIDGNPIPEVNQRTADATLTVRSGQAIMLGGYFTDTKEKSQSGVPVLKDIPILGALFRSRNHSNDRTELIILIQAKVLQRPEDAAVVAEEEKAKFHGLTDTEIDSPMSPPVKTGPASH